MTALILCDYDGDGENEVCIVIFRKITVIFRKNVLQLIVGSDDFDLRVFKGDTIVDETSESDAIASLLHIEGFDKWRNIFLLGFSTFTGDRFAYALANGTLGIYQGMNRLWRIKVHTIHNYPEKIIIP